MNRNKRRWLDSELSARGLNVVLQKVCRGCYFRASKSLAFYITEVDEYFLLDIMIDRTTSDPEEFRSLIELSDRVINLCAITEGANL